MQSGAESARALIGDSAAMGVLRRAMAKAARAKHPVLILGESGSGKELVARAVHGLSGRETFVALDCGALPTTLVESELFGYAKGAFTGASAPAAGLMRAAEGGTLFFDEIGELPLEAQGKLLRALQEREVRPLGSATTVPVDVRIIAATSRDLDAPATAGSFRPELYYRLNVIKLRVPPLRERKEDIPELVEHFLQKHGDRRGLQVSREALQQMLGYDWPGNVRELENAIARAVAMSSGPEICVADLPTQLHSAAIASRVRAEQPGTMAALAKEAILAAVTEANGDKQRAAKLLGIGKTTLYRKLKEYQAGKA